MRYVTFPPRSMPKGNYRMNQTVDPSIACTGTPLPAVPDGRRAISDVAVLIRDHAPDGAMFCFSARNAMAAARRFHDGFAGTTSFAVKACPVPQVITAFAAAGIDTFDVASPEEMALVRSVLPEARLNYHNPIRSPAEDLLAVRDFGCLRFAVDDMAGLDRLSETVGDLAGYEVAVRLRAERNAGRQDFTGKFGAAPENAVRLLRTAVSRGATPVVTFHAGSQCLDPTAFADLIMRAAHVCADAGIVPAVLNVGGGFPAPYTCAPVPPLQAFFQAIERCWRAQFDSAATRLECEPGRALAAPTMSLLASVKHRRADGTLHLADGVYGGFQELMVMPVDLPLRVWRGHRLLEGDRVPVTAYGPTCDPVDRLTRPLLLPADTRPGDRIEFGLLGAYGPATLTRFNGYGAVPVIAVDDILTVSS